MTALVYEASQQKCCCGFESLRLYKNNIVQLGSSIGNQSNGLQSRRLLVQILYGVHLNIVLSYNGYYVRFWLLRCRFNSYRDYKCGFSSVGGSVGLQNQRPEVRILQPVQAWSYGVGGCLLAGLKIQRPLFNSRWLRDFCSYGEMVNISDFQLEDASSILVSCSIYNAVVVQLEVHIVLPRQRLTRVRFSSAALIWVERMAGACMPD